MTRSRRPSLRLSRHSSNNSTRRASDALPPGHVESRTGAVAWAVWRHSVSCPRSSNRTCRFPASGFPTSFIVRHTEKSSGRKRPLRGGFPPSPYDTAFSEGSGLSGVVRLIANHLHLTIFESAPEVRVLSSAGVTQPQQSYDPVRLPSKPPPKSDVEAATLAQNGSPLITRVTFPTCRAQYPGGSKRVRLSIASPPTRPSPK